MQDAQDTMIVLTQAAVKAGVVPSAMADVLRRGLTAFADQPIDALTAEQWVAQLRPTCPHYFPMAAGAAAPVGTVRARRPQPVALFPTQAEAL